MPSAAASCGSQTTAQSWRADCRTDTSDGRVVLATSRSPGVEKSIDSVRVRYCGESATWLMSQRLVKWFSGKVRLPRPLPTDATSPRTTDCEHSETRESSHDAAGYTRRPAGSEGERMLILRRGQRRGQCAEQTPLTHNGVHDASGGPASGGPQRTPQPPQLAGSVIVLAQAPKIHTISPLEHG
jgi:hypothetical protein